MINVLRIYGNLTVEKGHLNLLITQVLGDYIFIASFFFIVSKTH
jgi:hypothetical protein